MTDRELLELLLKKFSGVEEQLSGIDKRLSNVESNMATKADITKLDAKIDKDVISILQLADKKIDKIASTQAVQGESINILAMRQLQTESEVAALKKAK
ncbi:MAG: hypothetical protein ABFC84_16480 [Veillonellales bacterium]